MKLPISWLKDFIDLDGLSVEDIARKLTLAGLEVDEILYVGLPCRLIGKARSMNSKPAASVGTGTKSLWLKFMKSSRIPTPTD